MIQLDEGEVKLFSKYWGDNDLAHNEDFWKDVYGYYSQEPRDAPMPVRYTPLTVRRVLGMLDCPPGQCGKCCKTYGVVSLSPYDRQRITDNTEYTAEDLLKILTIDEKGVYINSKSNGSCPFLKEDSCTIYEARPDGCYLFPISSKDAALDGVVVQQMLMRIRCPEALAVARELITQALSKGDKILLPDLTIIPIYKE